MSGHETAAGTNACVTTRAPADSSGRQQRRGRGRWPTAPRKAAAARRRPAADGAAEGSRGADEAGGRQQQRKTNSRRRPWRNTSGQRLDRSGHTPIGSNTAMDQLISACSWRWTYAKAKSRPAGKRATAAVQEIGSGVARVATCEKNT